MAYRSIDTAMWQDPFVERLSANAKLLFLYFCTNSVCNQAGLYQLSQRRVEFETGVELTDQVLSELEPKVIWHRDREIVWVKNFFKRQCANRNFAICALRSVANLPKDIIESFMQYNLNLISKYRFNLASMGIDTHPIPIDNPPDTHPIPTDKGTQWVAESGTDTVPDTDISTANNHTGGSRGVNGGVAVGPESDGESEPKAANGGNKIPYREIISHLNKVSGKTFKTDPVTEINREVIRARWKEGFRFEHFAKVNVHQSAAWTGDPKMEKFIRPVTLYNRSKFEGYLNNPPVSRKISDTTRENIVTLQEWIEREGGEHEE